MPVVWSKSEQVCACAVSGEDLVLEAPVHRVKEPAVDRLRERRHIGKLLSAELLPGRDRLGDHLGVGQVDVRCSSRRVICVDESSRRCSRASVSVTPVALPRFVIARA
jgi:hypothetical protein